MFVDFFIERPIFAGVISIIIVLAGIVCIPLLPVAQFPEISPPTVQVSASYTGASAEVVEQAVTAPLEEQINGVEGMMYMTSTSASDGSSTINVTFEVGYDLDIAAVDVQNRVSMATPQLPEDVTRVGVTTKKQSTNFIQIISLFSQDSAYDDLFLSNYASINLVDSLKRLDGVGDVSIFGERTYSMRIWMDPDKMTSLGLTPMDVIAAVQDQNIQVAAGRIGDQPSPSDQVFTYSIVTKGRLSEPGEFEDIIIRSQEDGSMIRVKDVAKVELGAESYGWYSKLNGQSCANIGIYQLPGANALDIAKSVEEEMQRLSKRFPQGIEYRITYDTTRFVQVSIEEVLTTLAEAFLLVFMVVYIFLQGWRTTLIPALTIPVSLIGTFAVMMAMGFSINTLSLFGLVLAIGLVVDDAIVVVENVERCIHEKNMKPKEATKEAMREVTGPVIATTAVLMAVFVPVAFMPGISGRLYQQFALTIAISVGISALNALTLSPALCVVLLRPGEGPRNWFFRGFNAGFEFFRAGYLKIVQFLIKGWPLVLAGFGVLLGVTYFYFTTVPTGFVPMEDQGYFFVTIQGPDGSSLPRTQTVDSEVEGIVRQIPGVQDVITIGGFNILSGTLDAGFATQIVVLTPWEERTTPETAVDGIIAQVWKRTAGIQKALVFAFNSPPISGLSTTGGFEFELQDLQSGELTDLRDVAQQLISAAKDVPSLQGLSTTFEVNYPQYYIDLDRDKAKTMGVSISDIFTTLQAYLGSMYVNDFNKFGRIYRVYIQAAADDRKDLTDISKLYVRNSAGAMVPLGGLVNIEMQRGVQNIKHYNVYRTVSINGDSAPGYSSGQAIQAMEGLAQSTLPDGYGYEWTGTALQELESGGMAPLIFGLALIFVFLFLAAQYESWTMPLMVMLAVPLALLGALVAQSMRGLVNDVYCQIGLVMLIGLSSKNAILIVEFAKQLREKGHGIVESAVMSARERVRPILMTAFAFILGVVPLVVASGAGAASRHSLGTAVFGGMIASTFLSLLLVPVLYVLIERMREKCMGSADKEMSEE